METKNISVVILCGGFGTRLQSVLKDKPKPLVDINGNSFLDILIGYISSFGFEKFILCIGYLGDIIKQYYRGRTDLEFVFSEEDQPLGTGGAVKKALSLVEGSPIVVTNGDSICYVDFGTFLDFHEYKKALLSMVLVKGEPKDQGLVTLNGQGKVTQFQEKSTKEGYINAGIYLLKKGIVEYMPDVSKFSLEYDVFPRVVGQGFYGYTTEGPIFDIGTPERLESYKERF